MLTMFYSPYACSMASHVALEEAGAVFEAKKINIFTGENNKPNYLAINHRAKVPALRFDDGRVLLETTAILGWVGSTHLQGRLLGTNAIDRARTIAHCAWLSASVHSTFKQFIHPEQYVADTGSQGDLKAQAKDTYWTHLRELDAMAADQPWIMGDEFTLADAYTLVFFPWGRDVGLPINELTNLTALKDRLLERPAARRALERERSVLLQL